MSAMDVTAPPSLPAHPAFAGLSPAGRSRVEQQLSRRANEEGAAARMEPFALEGVEGFHHR